MIDNTNPNNYISKGAALGTSIPALALAAIPYLTGGNGLGGLGGLFGGGNAAVLAGGTAAAMAEKDAKIAQLTAEKYSDNQDAATYKQTLSDNRILRDELYAFIKPIAEESAANRERVAVLEAQVKCEAEKAALREQIFQQKIDLEASKRECCCEKNAAAIAAVASIVAQITKVGVPNEALCPGVPPVTVEHTTTTTTPAA